MAAINPLIQAHKLGEDAIAELGALFNGLGNSKNPGTPLLAAYRTANTALRKNIADGGDVQGIRDIMAVLRRVTRAQVFGSFQRAAAGGRRNAEAQLRAYGRKVQKAPPLGGLIDNAYRVIETKLDVQEATILALLLSGGDTAIITGDENRLGILRASDVVVAAAYWIAHLWDERFGSVTQGEQFSKQAIAALDHRTTDCCLRVHSQIKPLDGRYHLTGTPRFSDYLAGPPFHHWCRTATVLYLHEYDDGITPRMRASADLVLAERAAGTNKYRWPVDAFARP